MQRVIPALQERNCVNHCFYAGCGTSAYRSQSSTSVSGNLRRRTYYLQKFPKSLAARSDLNPCDYWPWGYLKDRVYQGYVRSLVDLKTSIQRHVAQIPRELLRATIDHAILGMQHVVEASDAHIENIL